MINMEQMPENEVQFNVEKLEQNVQDLLVKLANERYGRIMRQASVKGTQVLVDSIRELVLEYAQFLYNTLIEDAKVTADSANQTAEPETTEVTSVN